MSSGPLDTDSYKPNHAVFLYCELESENKIEKNEQLLSYFLVNSKVIG